MTNLKDPDKTPNTDHGLGEDEAMIRHGPGAPSTGGDPGEDVEMGTPAQGCRTKWGSLSPACREVVGSGVIPILGLAARCQSASPVSFQVRHLKDAASAGFSSVLFGSGGPSGE